MLNAHTVRGGNHANGTNSSLHGMSMLWGLVDRYVRAGEAAAQAGKATTSERQSPRRRESQCKLSLGKRCLLSEGGEGRSASCAAPEWPGVLEV